MKNFHMGLKRKKLIPRSPIKNLGGHGGVPLKPVGNDISGGRRRQSLKRKHEPFSHFSHFPSLVLPASIISPGVVPRVATFFSFLHSILMAF